MESPRRVLLVDDSVDCVVSDYELPELDGLQLLAAVREGYPDAPFILFTDAGDEEIASEAIAAGVTDYLRNDGAESTHAVLAIRIENAVERRRAEEPLRAERRHYELVGRAAGEAFWDWDLETDVVERSG